MTGNAPQGGSCPRLAWLDGLALVVGGAAVWLTYNLNSGSRFSAPVVLVNLSQHGDLVYFTISGVTADVGAFDEGPRLHRAYGVAALAARAADGTPVDGGGGLWRTRE